jgi:probable addiction module antidote protein
MNGEQKMTTTISAQPWHAHQQLEDSEMIAIFLEQALEDATEFNDMSIFQRALSEAAKAQKIVDLAEKSGLARESIYKSIKPNSKPRFETVQKILTSMGYTLKIEPINAG